MGGEGRIVLLDVQYLKERFILRLVGLSLLKDCVDKIWCAYIRPSICPFNSVNIHQVSMVRAEVC